MNSEGSEISLYLQAYKLVYYSFMGPGRRYETSGS